MLWFSTSPLGRLGNLTRLGLFLPPNHVNICPIYSLLTAAVWFVFVIFCICIFAYFSTSGWHSRTRRVINRPVASSLATSGGRHPLLQMQLESVKCNRNETLAWNATNWRRHCTDAPGFWLLLMEVQKTSETVSKHILSLHHPKVMIIFMMLCCNLLMIMIMVMLASASHQSRRTSCLPRAP